MRNTKNIGWWFPVRDCEIRTHLPTRKTGDAYNPFAVNAMSGIANPFYVSPENVIFREAHKRVGYARLAIAACYYFFIFTALITVDSTSCDSGPSGNNKTTCNDEDALQDLINSAGSRRQYVAGHLNCPKYS